MPHKLGHYAWDNETSRLIYDEDYDLFAPEDVARTSNENVVEELELPEARPEQPPSILSWFNSKHPNQSALIPSDHQLRAIKQKYPTVHRYWMFIHEQRDKARAKPHTLRVGGQEVDAEQYWEQQIRDYNPSASENTAVANRQQWDHYNDLVERATEANIANGMSPDQAFAAAKQSVPKPTSFGVQGVTGRGVTDLDPEEYSAYLMERDQKIVNDAQSKQRSVNVATQVRNDPDLSALLGEAIQLGIVDWRSLSKPEAGVLNEKWRIIVQRWSSKYGEDFTDQHRQELEQLWTELRHKTFTTTPEANEIVKRKREEWIDQGGDPAEFDPDKALRDEWAYQRWLRSEDGIRHTKEKQEQERLEREAREREENRRNFEERQVIATWEKSKTDRGDFEKRLRRQREAERQSRIHSPIPNWQSTAVREAQLDARTEFQKQQEEMRNAPGTDIQSVYLDAYRQYGYGGIRNNPNWSPEQVSEMVFQAVNEILIKNGAPTYERNGEQFAVLRSLHDRFYRETIDGAVRYDHRYDEFDSKSQMYFDYINELMELEKKLTGAKTEYFTGENFREATIDGESPSAKLTQEEFARIQELREKVYELKIELGAEGDGLLQEALKRHDWYKVDRMKFDNMQRLQKETLAAFRNTYNKWNKYFKSKHNLPLKYSMLTEDQLDYAFGQLSSIYGEWAAEWYLKTHGMDQGHIAAGSETVHLTLGIAKDQVMNILGGFLKSAQTGFSDEHKSIVEEIARDKYAINDANAAITRHILESQWGKTGSDFAHDAASGLGSLIAFMGIGKIGQLIGKAAGLNATAVGMSLMGVGVAYESYERAIASGVPSDVAKLKGTLDMVAELGPMALGIGISKAFPKVSPGWAKWLSGKNTTKVSQGIVTARRRAINDFVSSLPSDLAPEVLQEIMTGFMQQGTDWYFGLDPTGMDMDQILDMAYHTTISTLFGTIGSSAMQARMAGSQQEQYHKARQHFMQDMIQYINPDGTFSAAHIPPMMHTLDPKAVEDFIKDPSRKNARILFGDRIDEALAKEGERGSSLETRQRLASQLDLMRPVDGIHINAKSPLEDLGYLDKPTPKDEPTIGPTERVQEEVIEPQQNAPVVVTVENADGTKSRIRVEKKDGQEITQEEAEQKVEDQLNDGTLAGRDSRFEGSSVFRPEREPLIEEGETDPAVVQDAYSDAYAATELVEQATQLTNLEDPVTQQLIEDGTLRVEENGDVIGKNGINYSSILREDADRRAGIEDVEAPELRPMEDVPVFENLDQEAEIAADDVLDSPGLPDDSLLAEVDELDPSIEDTTPQPPEDVPDRVDRRRRQDNLDKLDGLDKEQDAIFTEIQFLEQALINPETSSSDRNLAEQKKKQAEKRLQEITKERKRRRDAFESPGDIKFGETVEVTGEAYDEMRETKEMPDAVAQSIANKILKGEQLTDLEMTLSDYDSYFGSPIQAEVDRLSTPGEQTETSEVSEDGNYYFDEDTDTWQPTEQATQSMLQKNQKWDASKRQWVRTLPSEREAEWQAEKTELANTPTTSSYGSNARQWTPEQQQEKDDEAFAQWQAKPGNENAEIVNLDESDPDAQRVTAFAEQFGLRIVFATGTSADGMAAFDPAVVGGAMNPTGVIVLNADQKGDALFEVAAHEIAHGTGLDLDSDVMPQGFEVANDQELEDIWNEFLDGLDPVSRAANIAKASSNPQFARREAMARYIAGFFKSESFRNEAMGKRPGFVRKIIEFFNVFKPKMSPEQRRVIDAIKRKLNKDGYDTREGMQAVVPHVKPILLKSDFQKELEAKSPQELMQQAKDLGLKVVGRSPEALRQEIAKALAAQSAAEGTAPTIEQADENAKKKAESLSPEEIDATRKRIDEKDRKLGDDLRNAGLLSQRAIPQEALSPTGLPKHIENLTDPSSPFEIVEEINDYRRAEKLWDEGADLYYSLEQAEGDLFRVTDLNAPGMPKSDSLYVVRRSDTAPTTTPLFSERPTPFDGQTLNMDPGRLEALDNRDRHEITIRLAESPDDTQGSEFRVQVLKAPHGALPGRTAQPGTADYHLVVTGYPNNMPSTEGQRQFLSDIANQMFNESGGRVNMKGVLPDFVRQQVEDTAVQEGVPYEATESVATNAEQHMIASGSYSSQAAAVAALNELSSSLQSLSDRYIKSGVIENVQSETWDGNKLSSEQSFQYTQAPQPLFSERAKVKGQSKSTKNKHGLEPRLRVTTRHKKTGKPRFQIKTTNKNAPTMLGELESLLDRHKSPESSEVAWNNMMVDAYGSNDIPAAPRKLINDLQSGEAGRLISSLTDGQLAEANIGFENAAEFRDAYVNGRVSVKQTGKLFLWSFLSRGVSPYAQESLFLNAWNGIDQWIEAAANGTLNKEDYEAWAKSVAPKGTGVPGAGATHNLNAFGHTFLLKMSQDTGDGRSGLQLLHDMMSDPNSTGTEIRRAFQKIGQGVGIDNKVVSFTLLVAGYKDVMVIDRVQLRHLWNDGTFDGINLWDGDKVPVTLPDGTEKKQTVTGSSLAAVTYGVRGLVLYEAIERAIQSRIQEIYNQAGRPQDASIGRYHWESWVAASQQEASHATLHAILSDIRGEADPISGLMSREGDYGQISFGARYGIDDNGGYIVYNPPGGGLYRFTLDNWAKFRDTIAKKGKDKVLPPGFVISYKFVQAKRKLSEEEKRLAAMPWFDRPGVNKDKINQEAMKYGIPTGETTQDVRSVDGTAIEGQAVPDRHAADQPDAPRADSRRPKYLGRGRSGSDGRRIYPGSQSAAAGSAQIAESSRGYVDENTGRFGLSNIQYDSPVVIDVERSKRNGQKYEDAPATTLSDPETRQAYELVAEEVLAQYEWMTEQDGITVEFVIEDPYADSTEMVNDVTENKTLRVYLTSKDSFGSADVTHNHPLLEQSGLSTPDGHPLNYNDLFRAVHDYFGHAAEGNEFGPVGEERATAKHVTMFSPLAARAMAFETRGQNSWVNFGPHMWDQDGWRGSRDHPRFIPVKDRPFADQKVGLMPEDHMKDLTTDQQVIGEPLFSERSADKRKVDFAKQMAESAMERIATGESMYDAINSTLEAAGVNLADFYNNPNDYPKVVELRNLIEGFLKTGHRKSNSSVDKAAAYLDQSGTTAAMEAILEEVDKTVSGAPEIKHLEDMAVEAMNGIDSMEHLAKQVDILLTHFREFKRPLKDREQAAVILVLNYHMAELNGLGQQLNAAIQDGDSDTASSIANDISVLEKTIEGMALDNIAIGTEAGRALVSRRLGDTYRTVKMDIASILNRAVATKRNKLTGDEKDTLMSLYNEHERLKKEIEEMRESVAEEQANSVIYSKSRKRRKTQTMQQATAEKPSIKDFELAAKLEQLAKDRAC